MITSVRSSRRAVRWWFKHYLGGDSCWRGKTSITAMWFDEEPPPLSALEPNEHGVLTMSRFRVDEKSNIPRRRRRCSLTW